MAVAFDIGWKVVITVVTLGTIVALRASRFHTSRSRSPPPEISQPKSQRSCDFSQTFRLAKTLGPTSSFSCCLPITPPATSSSQPPPSLIPVSLPPFPPSPSTSLVPPPPSYLPSQPSLLLPPSVLLSHSSAVSSTQLPPSSLARPLEVSASPLHSPSVPLAFNENCARSKNAAVVGDDTERSIRAHIATVGRKSVMASLVPLEMLRRRRDGSGVDGAGIVLCALPKCRARVVVRVLACTDHNLVDARERTEQRNDLKTLGSRSRMLGDARDGAIEAALSKSQECARHFPVYYGTYTVCATEYLLGTLSDTEEEAFRRGHGIADGNMPRFTTYARNVRPRLHGGHRRLRAIDNAMLSCTIIEYVPFTVADYLARFIGENARQNAADALVLMVARKLVNLQTSCDFRHHDLHANNLMLRKMTDRRSSSSSSDGGNETKGTINLPVDGVTLREEDVAFIDLEYACAETRPGERVYGPSLAAVEYTPADSKFRKSFNEYGITPSTEPARLWYDLATFAHSYFMSSGGPRLDEINGIDLDKISGIDRDKISGIDRDKISGIDRDKISGIDRDKISGIDRDKISGIDRDKISGIDRDKISGIDNTSHRSLTATFFVAHGVEWNGSRPLRVTRPFSPADYVRYVDDPARYLSSLLPADR